MTATQDASKELTVAEAAKLVKRTVTTPPEKEGGKPVTKKVEIEASEVLDFKDYGDHVVVVTKDGQKFTGKK
jgi:hypothetical protein